jgi:voltage-gated potassium channel
MIESVAEPRVQAWERRTEWPLTIVALLFLVAFAWPIL